MTYTYDILANFNENYYDFYDWNNMDEIIHIKRLPIIKVDRVFLNNIKHNEVIVEKDLLEKIYKKTELFKINKKNTYNHICALCDGTKAIIVKFEPTGKVSGRSSLLIDEENEIIDISETLQTIDYKLKQNKNKKIDNFKTRKEIEISKYIQNELKNIDDEKLKYLYFDCFDEKETDTKIILKKLMNEIKNNFENIYMKIYDFLKLASLNK